MSILVRKKDARRREKAALKERKRIWPKKPSLPALGLPEDVVTDQARLIILGDTRVLVENHRGVVELSDQCVRIMTRQGILNICGDRLTLSEVRETALSVQGSILSVEMPGHAWEAPHA